MPRASTKDASTATWVSTPLLRSGSEARGSVDAADDDDDGAAEDDEPEVESVEEQAARLKIRAPEATMPKADLVMVLREMFMGFSLSVVPGGELTGVRRRCWMGLVRYLTVTTAADQLRTPRRVGVPAG